MTPGLVVIDTGSANLASIRATFRRLGVPAATTRDPDVARRAARAVMPGVGAFGAVMARLTESGMAESIRERVEAGRPLLAVCLGLQLLARGSEEAPAITGLGVLPADARRYPRTSVVPQLGWNRVLPDNREGLVREGHAFFANSYYVDVACDGWTPSWATHDVRFVAALERGPQLACQFHPELSGAWGAALLDRWYRAC
ncbi:MAG TPA: imidazole glycerol phosphate synthase subunit HisH [Gemmatimonadaceae bacterium]|nr:imidazole glycerol phosphate synthase subunit HisH [Gemmatimonadaceae bacterium]